MNTINLYQDHPEENFINNVVQAMFRLKERDHEIIQCVIMSFNPTEKQFYAFKDFLNGKIRQGKLDSLYQTFGMSTSYSLCHDIIKELEQRLFPVSQQNPINNLTNAFNNISINK